MCTSRSSGLCQCRYYVLVLSMFAKNQLHVVQQGKNITITGVGRPCPQLKQSNSETFTCHWDQKDTGTVELFGRIILSSHREISFFPNSHSLLPIELLQYCVQYHEVTSSNSWLLMDAISQHSCLYPVLSHKNLRVLYTQ